MSKLSHSSNRRRWLFCLIFLLAGTLSLVGPTRAVSGLVTASVVVTEAFTQMLAPETAGSKRPASAASVGQRLDEATTLAFSNLIGAEPSESVGDGIEFAAVDDRSNNALVSQTTTQSEAGQFGGGGAPRGARTRAGSSGGGQAGAGGLGGGGFGGGFTQDGAIEDAIAEQLGSADLGLDASTLSLVTPFVGSDTIELDDSILAAPFASPPRVPISDSSDGGAPSISPTAQDLSPFGPAAALSPGIPIAGGADTPGGDIGPAGPNHSDRNDPFTPLVVAGLLDDLGLPPDLMSSRSSLAVGGNDAAENGGFSVAQIPEPSTVILVSLGLVAMGRRRMAHRRMPDRPRRDAVADR